MTLYGDLDVRITLVVPQLDVEARVMGLDEVGFQDQGLGLRSNHDGFDVPDPTHQFQSLDGMGRFLSEIAANPGPKRLGLADVQDVSGVVEHGVPGEDLAKVVYRLIDPEQYRGQNVLVVGGGDSALEAAHSIAEEPGTDVTLSYRSEAFTRAKPKNRDKVALLAEQGRLRALMTSNVKSIAENTVDIAVNDKLVRLPNDVVIVFVGGVLPTGFLKNIGVDVETKYGTA